MAKSKEEKLEILEKAEEAIVEANFCLDEGIKNPDKFNTSEDIREAVTTLKENFEDELDKIEKLKHSEAKLESLSESDLKLYGNYAKESKQFINVLQEKKDTLADQKKQLIKAEKQIEALSQKTSLNEEENKALSKQREVKSLMESEMPKSQQDYENSFVELINHSNQFVSNTGKQKTALREFVDNAVDKVKSTFKNLTSKIKSRFTKEETELPTEKPKSILKKPRQTFPINEETKEVKFKGPEVIKEAEAIKNKLAAKTLGKNSVNKPASPGVTPTNKNKKQEQQNQR